MAISARRAARVPRQLLRHDGRRRCEDFGTVFKITPKGALSIIHSFANAQGEGYYPLGATLLNVNGKFYGSVSATYIGSGGIFEIAPSGSESLSYVFDDNPSGVASSVIDVGGMLYGTTINGGPTQQGTVYAVPL